MSPGALHAEEVDVAVVGLGPVGAFTVLLLAEAGLRVAVLERSREPVTLPRAVGLDGEAVRAFQRLGLADTVTSILQPPREKDELFFTDSRRRPYFGTAIPRSGPMGWRNVAFFDQPELEALLRELVAQRPGVDVRLGCEVVAVKETADGVAVRHREAPCGATRTLRAAYAVACDGASSTVRRQLGIPWRSLGYDQDWLVVDVVQGPDADLPLATLQVCDPARLVTYVCVKDPYRRWELQLLPGETREEMLRPERIAELLRPWAAPEHYEIRRSAVYQFHAATAERWREGRVFLAGDAAHQTPPFLGQGLNSGLRDAVNLGWKLPLVLAGVCGPALLESYERERDAHARDLVEWAVAIGKLMETLAAREAGRPDPHAADPRAGYGQGRTIPPLRDGILVDEQVRAGLPVGGVLHQPTVRTPDGATCRLDELLGRAFAVVGRAKRDIELGPEAAEILRRLDGRRVALEDLERVHGDPDPLFERHPVAVVRPDRYVFGVGDDTRNADRLLAELGRALALR